MAKPILLNTTFTDLGDVTLLCMTFELYVGGQQKWKQLIAYTKMI